MLAAYRLLTMITLDRVFLISTISRHNNHTIRGAISEARSIDSDNILRTVNPRFEILTADYTKLSLNTRHTRYVLPRSRMLRDKINLFHFVYLICDFK